MMNKLVYVSLASVFLMTSCGGGSKEETTKESQPVCSYSYGEESTVLEWTAFKFTEKSPVKGTFNEINVQGMEHSEDPVKLIESLEFSIPTSSVETQNEDRNAKIATLFFGTISTGNITGEVKKLNKEGKAVIAIKMNGISKDVEGEYTLEEGKFTFSASIDVLDWKAGEAINALNTACKDLHTGVDGKSKLWSQVDLSFSTQLNSDCQ